MAKKDKADESEEREELAILVKLKGSLLDAFLKLKADLDYEDNPNTAIVLRGLRILLQQEGYLKPKSNSE